MYDLIISSVFCHGKVFITSFTGKAEASGRMHVTLCDYIMAWDSLSTTQKKGLSQRYQMGCECKVGEGRAMCVYLFDLQEFHLPESKADIIDQIRRDMREKQQLQQWICHFFLSERICVTQ